MNRKVYKPVASNIRHLQRLESIFPVKPLWQPSDNFDLISVNQLIVSHKNVLKIPALNTPS